MIDKDNELEKTKRRLRVKEKILLEKRSGIIHQLDRVQGEINKIDSKIENKNISSKINDLIELKNTAKEKSALYKALWDIEEKRIKDINKKIKDYQNKK